MADVPSTAAPCTTVLVTGAAASRPRPAIGARPRGRAPARHLTGRRTAITSDPRRAGVAATASSCAVSWPRRGGTSSRPPRALAQSRPIAPCLIGSSMNCQDSAASSDGGRDLQRRAQAGSAWRWPAWSARSPGSATGRCRRSGRRSSAAAPSRVPGRRWCPGRRSRRPPPRWRPRAGPGRRGRRTASTRPTRQIITPIPARPASPATSSSTARPACAARCARRALPDSARPSPAARRSAGRRRGCRCPRRPCVGSSAGLVELHHGEAEIAAAAPASARSATRAAAVPRLRSRNRPPISSSGHNR